MKGKVFLDTNILVYLFSSTELEKKAKCTETIRRLKQDSILVWSTQVVQELYQVLTKKFDKQPQQVKSILNQFWEFELVINDMSIINNAIDIQILNKLSFWDSMIISSALSSKCSVILTEDLNHGQSINGVLLQNPLKDG